jgi:hypothetical protein
MLRTLFTSLVVLAALLIAQPAAAGEPTARELESMVVQLERLFEPLAGSVARQDLVFTRHGAGVYSLRADLNKVGVSALSDDDDDDDDDKLFRLLAAGHMASEPTSPAMAVNAVVSSPETMYNIWWAVVNQGDEEQERNTIVKITGPEEFELEVSDKVVYAASSVQLFFFNPELLFEVGGIYTHRTTVRKAGKNLYKFWVE